MKLEEAQVFANVLRAPLAEVLEHAGLFDALPAAHISPAGPNGADDVTPYVAQDRTNDPLGRTLGTLTEQMLRDHRLDAMSVTSRALELDGILPGDIVFIERNGERARPGDIVLVEVQNHAQSPKSTIIRRYDPPVVTPHTMDTSIKRAHIVDDTSVVIAGKVRGTWRTTPANSAA